MFDDVRVGDFVGKNGITAHAHTFRQHEPCEASAIAWAVHIPKGKLIVSGQMALPIVEGQTCLEMFWDASRWRVQEEIVKPAHVYRGKISGAIILLGHSGMYHFVVERLPMLAFLRDFSPHASIRWATRSWIPNPYGELFPDLLSTVLEDRQLLRLELEDGEYDIDDVIMPQATAREPAGIFHRNLTLPLILKRGDLSGASASSGPTKLFVRRTALQRLLVNQEEIEEWYVERGFTSVDPGQLTLREQALVFASAREIVGVEGGALTNLVFANNAQSVTVLCNPLTVREHFFSTIVAPFGTAYHAISGRFAARDAMRNSDFSIPLDVLEKAHITIEAQAGAPVNL